MKMYFKGVLNSFRNKKILPVFLMELTFLIISGLLIYSYKRIVEIKQLAIGKNAAELQQILQSTSSELIEVAPLLQSFLLTFLVGGILLLVTIFLLYSFSRAKIWNYLTGKKLTRKSFWKWNGLNSLLILLLIIYLIPVAIIKTATNFIISFINNQTITLYLNNLLTIMLSFFFITLVYLIYYNFAKNYSVWKSIGDSFHVLKLKWNVIYKFLFTCVMLNIILTLIFYYPIKVFSPSLIPLILAMVSIFLLLAWYRTFLISKL